MTNSRTLQFGGYGSQVNIHDVGAAVSHHWFDDSDTSEPTTDLSDGEATPQGTDFAVVRGYGNSTHIMWYPSPDVRSGLPAVPDAVDEGLRDRPGGRHLGAEVVPRQRVARARVPRRHLGQAPARDSPSSRSSRSPAALSPMGPRRGQPRSAAHGRRPRRRR